MEGLPSTGTDSLITRPMLLTGVAAPLLYAFTVVWGATLFPGYNHLAEPISSLTQAGREGAANLDGLFFIYNVLVIAYGISGISLSPRRRYWIASFSFLIATGFAGLLMWLFRQDAVGSTVTLTGVVHIGLAAVTSLGSIGAIGAAILACRGRPELRPLRLFSLACLVIVFVSGGLAALGIGSGWSYAGLLERITIGAFELWLFVVAGTLLARAIAARMPYSSRSGV